MKRIHFETIDSTNTWALEHFNELDDKTAVTSEQQTRGKGRFDRSWVSPESENIYLSFILKPEKQDYVANLTQYLSVCTARTIETYGAEPQIKWPNDVLLEEKKAVGILCEAKREKNILKGVVLGIGVNLNMDKETITQIDRPATSLNLVLNKKIDKDKFLDKLLEEFFKDYENFIENGFTSIKDEYLKYACFVGKNVKIQQRDGAEIEKYLAKTVNENGNLIVEDENGNEKTFFSGDLIL